MNDNEPYMPDDVDQDFFSELVEKFEILKTKHRRRKRSPLKFVEAFDEFRKARGIVYPWPAIEGQVKAIDEFAATLEKDYQDSLWPAREQSQRNELWDDLFKPRPRIYEGGRADGNR